jgi:hypothetical protein
MSAYAQRKRPCTTGACTDSYFPRQVWRVEVRILLLMIESNSIDRNLLSVPNVCNDIRNHNIKLRLRRSRSSSALSTWLRAWRRPQQPQATRPCECHCIKVVLGLVFNSLCGLLWIGHVDVDRPPPCSTCNHTRASVPNS